MIIFDIVQITSPKEREGFPPQALDFVAKLGFKSDYLRRLQAKANNMQEDRDNQKPSSAVLLG